MKLNASKVLLTGASGGIGAAMTAALKQHGAQVLGVRRQAVHADGHPCNEWLHADLSTAEGIRHVAQAAKQWGANVVVHAAGLPGFGAAGSLSPSQTAALLQTNLWAPIVLTEALLPHLLAQSSARVVFIGSALGRIGVPGYGLYGASKAGVHHFAEALRRELMGTPIRVQLLAPRSTRTAFNSHAAQGFAQATGSTSDSPDKVAEALVRLMQSNAPERVIGWPEKGLVRLNGAVGPWLDGGFTRHRAALNPQPIQGNAI